MNKRILGVSLVFVCALAAFGGGKTAYAYTFQNNAMNWYAPVNTILTSGYDANWWFAEDAQCNDIATAGGYSTPHPMNLWCTAKPYYTLDCEGPSCAWLGEGSGITIYNAAPSLSSGAGPNSCAGNSYSGSGAPIGGCDLYYEAGTPLPTATLSANPTSITSGGNSNLTWGSTNATSCTSPDFTIAGNATSGNVSVSPGSTTTYHVTCTGAGGTSNTPTATVTVTQPPPTCSMSGSQTIVAGNPATITWSSTNTTTTTGTNFSTGGATSGAVPVSPGSTTTYSVSCTGPGGGPVTSNTITVTVLPVLSATCSVNTTSMNSGSSATWTATPSGGTGSYTYSWSGTDSLSGSGASVARIYNLSGTKTASVTVTSGSQSNTFACSNSVSVYDAPVAALSPSSQTVTNGNQATFNYACTGGSTSASMNQGVGALSPLVSTKSVTPPSDSTTPYTLTCTSPTGLTAQVSANVTAVASTQCNDGIDNDGDGQIDYPADGGCSSGTDTTENTDNANLTVTQPNAPTTATVGYAVTFTGRVDNTAAKLASPAFTSYWAVDGVTASVWSTPGITLAGNTNASVTAGTTYTFGSSGVHTVMLCADGTNAVNEANEGDNCGAPTNVTVYAAPIASLTPPTQSVTDGNQATFNYACTGGATSASISPGGALPGTSGTANPVPPSDTTTTYTLTCTNPDGKTATATASATAAAAPADVKVTSAPSGGGGDVVANTSNTFNGTVLNIGGTAINSVPSVLQVLDSTGTTNVMRIAASPATVNLPATTGSAAVSATIPANTLPGGTYQVRFCGNMNTVGTIPAVGSESDTSNNCGSTFQVIVRPVLTASCSPSSSSISTGGSTTWTASPSGGTGSYTYSWTATGGSPSSGTASTLTSTYASAGTYSATVTVTSGTQTLTNVACTSSVSVTTQADVKVTAAPAGGSSDIAANVANAFTGTVLNIGGTAINNVPSVLQVLDSTGTTNVTRIAASPATVNLPATTGSAAISGTIPANTLAAGTYQVRFCGNINTSGTVPAVGSESDTSNNCGATFQVIVRPVLTASCSPSATSISTGGSVTWTATVSGGTGSNTYSWTATGGSPSSGSASTLTTTYGSAGTYSATVTVTSGTQTLTNVACSQSVTATNAPDLTVTAAPTGTAAVTVGATDSFSGTARNIGNATGTNFPNILQILDSTATTNVNRSSAAPATVTVAAGGSTAITGSYQFNTPGTYTVRFCANTDLSGNPGVISESNTGNNCGLTMTVTVSAAPIASLTPASQSVTNGSSANLNYACTGGSSTASMDQGVGALSPLSSTKPVTPPSNATTTYTLTCTNPAGSTATASAAVGASAVTQPDLTVSAAPTGTAAVTVGATDSFSGVARNIGTATGTNFPNILQILDSTGTTNVNRSSAAPATVTVAAGGSTAITGSYQFNSAGTYTVRFCANTNLSGTPGVIAESNTGDDCGPTMSVTVYAAPLASLTPASQSVTNGSSANLNYACTGGSSSASMNQGVGALSPLSSTKPVTPPSNATTTYTLTCTNSAGSTATANADIGASAVTRPDLTVLSQSDVSVGSGGTVSLPATVKNIGTAQSSGAFSTYYWVDSDSTHTADPLTWGTQSGAIAGTNPLAVNGTQNVAQNWTAPSVVATTTYYYQYCTDWTGTITESNEGNNCGGWNVATITPPVAVLPDLSAGNVSTAPGSPTTGTTTTLTGLISNANASTGGSFSNVFEIDNDGTHTLFSDIYAKVATTSPTLAAGGSITGQVSYNFPSSGIWYLRLCADADGANNGSITESNEGNNCSSAWTQINVGGPTGNTLSCSPSPTQVDPGDSVTWTPQTNLSGSVSYTWTDSYGTPLSPTNGAEYVNKYSTAQGGSSYVVNLSATNGSATVNASCSPVTVGGIGTTCNAGPTPSITTTSNLVVSGNSTVVSWSATGITPAGSTCSITGVNAAGTTVLSQTTTTSDASCNIVSGGTNQATITNITSQTTVTINCGGVTKSIKINVIPRFQEF